MINVFYLVYGLTSGGIEKYSVTLYKHLDKSKYNFQFIVSKDNNDFFDDVFHRAGGKKIVLGDKTIKNKFFYRIKYLRTLIKVSRNNYDIAYFNLSSPAAVFKYPLICRVFGIKKIIIHSHNSNQYNSNVFKKILNYVGRCYINKITTAKFACSDKAATWMFGKKVSNSNAYKLINNGLEVSKYDYNLAVRAKMRKKLDVVSNQLVVGHVGRFVEQKNHEFLLEIFKKVLNKKPNAVLILIGVGELEARIKLRAKELGILTHIKFLGEKNNVNEYMQAMDVFLLPSLYEGLPVVGIEAQATGLHGVFSSTISQEVDITGNIKFLDLSENPEVWAEEVIRSSMAKRKSEKEQVKKSGYDIVHTAHQVEATIDKLMR